MHTEAEQRERIHTEIHPHADGAAAALADEIAALIRANNAAGKHTVLGLATGSSPVRLYRQLIRMHREKGLSFRRVITFNLDEYYGLPPKHPESYRRFMQEQLFDHIDVLPENTHVPDGMAPRAEVFAGCAAYENAIREAGGIDLQVLGIGRTGHIGFNEPGSARDSRTRLVTLDAVTRRDAARDFLGEANVPRHAITMGVGTILEARRIVLLGWGEAKADVIARAVEEPPSDALPASLLQSHRNCAFLIDQAAASALTRVQHPWLVGAVSWTPELVRRAVVWLSFTTKKPVLKLLDEDYSEHGMADLLTEKGPAYGLNIQVFNELQHTITGWPGGKPNADDSNRPERARPFPKSVVIFSPEPSHDVMGMGGTLRRLVEQGHKVTVVYQTSGNLAVPDEEVALATDLIRELTATEGPSRSTATDFVAEVRRLLTEQSEFDIDAPPLRKFKALLRRSEARAALQGCGIPPGAITFLDLPFYETGRYRQFAPSKADGGVITALLCELKPQQVFATGDRDDPSSIPAVCFRLVQSGCRELQHQEWFADCRVWLYRGVESPWNPAEVDMSVPLSPRELEQKTQAIFHHKTQRSQTPVASRLREPWQQAEQHSRELAERYDRLGLANYEAMEAFQRWQLE